MSTRPLPQRPDFDQLRRQAKELRNAVRASEPEALRRTRAYFPFESPITLSAAQLVIAREYGFASWRRLKVEVETRAMDLAARVEEFLRASVGGPGGRAAQLLERYPEIASYDFRTAGVLGDATRVRALLADDPGLAVRPIAPIGWPPLLGVCSSRWHRIDPSRANGLLEVASMLLDCGADPNTSALAGQRGHCSTLYAAAGTANNPAMTRLLLERGAIPDDKQDDHTLYLTAFHNDHECLRLVLARATNLDKSSALTAPISTGNIEGVRLLLEAGADARQLLPAELFGYDREADPPIGPVPAAIECGCSAELIELLLQHGADPDAPGRDGRTSLRLATRRGRSDVVETLERYGARDTVPVIDEFLAVCLEADRTQAERLLADHPSLLSHLSDEDHAAMLDAAERGATEAVRLMLTFGFPVNVRDEVKGCTPLHSAAFSGSAEVVRVLIDAGADLEAQDTTWNDTPLVWATVGSGMDRTDPNNQPNLHADFVATVRTLIEAGATIDDARPVPDKPPSAEVLELLVGYGIGPVDLVS